MEKFHKFRRTKEQDQTTHAPYPLKTNKSFKVSELFSVDRRGRTKLGLLKNTQPHRTEQEKD